MGCHTWFYRKIEVTYEEAKRQLVKSLTENITLCQKWVDDPLDKGYLEMKEYYSDWTPEYIQHLLILDKRKLRMIEKGLCKEAVMNKYDHKNEITRYIKGKGHWVSINLCDIFRIGNYPSDLLFSLDETFEFIEKNKESIYHFHYNEVQNKDYMQQLKEYWDSYPGGLISFG